jgi:inner membrane transporter RhtA
MVSFQTGAALAKSLFPVAGAIGTVGLRVGIAAVLMCAMWRPWRTALGRDAVIAVCLYGVSIAAMNTCFYQAIARLPLGITVAIEFVGPLAVALAGSRRALDVLWVGLVLAGLAALLHAHPASPRGLDPVGIAFAVAAAAAWAAYILFGVRLARLLPAGRATALGMTVAALLVVPPGLPHMGQVLAAPPLLAIAASIAVLSSALPYTLELVAMRRMSARAFGILMSIEPALAALSGLVLLGEHLALDRWIGIACIMAASAGSVVTGERSLST